MDLIKKILDKKYSLVIVSPHQDDAVLSCSTLLAELTGKTDITVVNVFTKAHKKPYTLSAKQFLKYSKAIDGAENLYKERAKEDKEVLSKLAITPIDLGFEDALFRRKKKGTFLGKFLPEFDHVYPTYRWHIVKGIAKDDYTIKSLKKKLLPFKNKKTVVLAPYGIGNHVDHRVVRKVCEELFDNLLLYSDFPYNVDIHTIPGVLSDSKMYKLKPDIKKKSKLLSLYKTQFLGLFPKGKVPSHEEVFYLKGNLLKI